jgi:hypothetical protein
MQAPTGTAQPAQRCGCLGLRTRRRRGCEIVVDEGTFLLYIDAEFLVLRYESKPVIVGTGRTHNYVIRFELVWLPPDPWD